jgi:hypothetical protein
MFPQNDIALHISEKYLALYIAAKYKKIGQPETRIACGGHVW